MSKVTKSTVITLSIFMLYGCAAVWFAAGGIATLGGYKYFEGQLSRDYPVSYTKAWNATNRALENLRVSISSSEKGTGQGKIEAIQKDGIKIVISLKDKGLGVTTITVRVGTLGDRLEAEKIHDEIASVAGVG